MTSPDAEYAALAPDYDRVWRAYNLDTAAATSTGLWDAADVARLGDGPVLDAGCGSGVLLEELHEFEFPLVGLDRSGPMLTVTRRRLPTLPLVRGDAASLPFADASFAAAVTNSALHYLPDPAVAVRELFRVLKPGGACVWTDWDGGVLTTRAVVAWLRLTGRPLGAVLSADAMAAAMTDAGFADVRPRRWRHGALWGLATVSGVKPPVATRAPRVSRMG